MKIYTGSGDRGKTSLFSGERVLKDHERIEAYGTLDELNAVLGALSAALPAGLADAAAEIERIQATLFIIGAWLATAPGAPAAASLAGLDPGVIGQVESAIDRMDAGLPPLKEFILPGGDGAAAWAHIARTVCRRAERRVVGLSAAHSDDPAADQIARALVFLNRLSDYLFVLARHINRLQGRSDIRWKG
jgi:cob(I)alamin adenosyltransferase